MDLEYREASMEDIMRFWVTNYELPPGHRISSWEWFANPKNGRVCFKCFVTDTPDPLA